MEQVAKTLLVAIVVVPVGDRFVLVQEAKAKCRGKWALPGGVVEYGESIAAAAVRESQEEAGIHVTPRGILGVEHVMYCEGEHAYTQKLRVIVVADSPATSLKEREDRESIQARLFSIGDVKRLDLREPRYVDWLQAYLNGSELLPIDRYRFSAARP